MSIHPTAVIDSGAIIEEDVEIGPYSYIGPNCRVGRGSRIHSHAVLQSYVTLGENCQVSPGAVLGGFPQDIKFRGEPSWVRIGNQVVIREGVTVNRASGENRETVVGDGCMLMAGSHVAHNCTLGREVVLANAVHLGGHAEVGDYAFLGGVTPVHQFVKIGRLAIISGGSATRQDIPPFSMTDGRPAQIIGINTVGLRRRGFDLAARTRMKKAFSLLWFSDLNLRDAMEKMPEHLDEVDDNVQELLAFIRDSKRGIRNSRHTLSSMDGPDSTSQEDQSEELSEYAEALC